MDERRFDGIARAWSGGMDRRGAFRSLAALLVAGWGGDRSIRSAAAQERSGPSGVCTSTAECRSRVDDRCIRARCWRGQCSFVAIRCAAGFRCCGNGRCCEDETVPGCASDAECGTNDPCIQSRCENRVCISLIVDCAPGFICCGNGECCSAA